VRRALASLGAVPAVLYQLEGDDPLVFAASAALLALVAMATGLVPALRASRIDPMRALSAF